jgi:Flp pilus assembly pilin Flp
MKRFLRRRSAERGATLIGYAVLTAVLVVASLSGIQAVDQSSQTVLGDTASSVGTPRPSVSATKTAPVSAAPPWATPTGAGYCSPGLDGCPLGAQLPFNPSDHVPTMDTIPSTGPVAPPALPNDDLDLVNSQVDVYVVQESLVQMNGEWTPPDGDDPLSGTPMTPTGVLPGAKICSFIVHTSPGSGTYTYVASIQFQGQILGTAYDSNLGQTGDTFASPDLTLASSADLESGEDNFSVAGDTLNIQFETSKKSNDELRVFVAC